MNTQLTLTVEGPGLVIALLRQALDESDSVHVVPASILPGYVVTVVKPSHLVDRMVDGFTQAVNDNTIEQIGGQPSVADMVAVAMKAVDGQ